jgi:7,8-dihydro-6-hydroxymethylpterin dimethyltransferase
MALTVHDYTILKSVRAVCPRCFAENDDFDPQYPTDICDGHLVERDGAVHLRRWCRRGHGEVWSLYEEHAELWRYLQQWRVPTKVVNPDTSEIFPIPMGYEYGLGPTHLQHSCIYLLDLTTQCNLTCPACYTSSSPALGHYLPVESVVGAVEAALEREGGRLDVVMLSGGEPTVHPRIREIVERLCEMPITRILLNTNGIRLAGEESLLEFVAELRDRMEIYLQYDGQRPATQETLRGLDLSATKERVVSRLSEARVFTTLVMTVVPENADQIGEVLDTAFATPYVGGVMYQPLFASGRAPRVDPNARVTTTGVLARLEHQSRNGIRARDLIALPCSHPDCCSIGYFLRDRRGRYAALGTILGEKTLRDNLSVFGNQIAFTEALTVVRDALTNVMSETMTLSRPELVRHLRTLCSVCGLGETADLLRLAFGRGATARFVGERVKRVTVKHFMDADTLITERLEQCCVHVAGAGNDPVRMPFCAARLFPKVRARAMKGMVRRGEIDAAGTRQDS